MTVKLKNKRLEQLNEYGLLVTEIAKRMALPRRLIQLVLSLGISSVALVLVFYPAPGRYTLHRRFVRWPLRVAL